jgi:hypothetical protein
LLTHKAEESAIIIELMELIMKKQAYN